MKQLNIEEIKKYSLEVLCMVDYVCEKHKIIYSLTGGTLIGAIRHKGFIPWDDDIDIMMPRSEYQRFINIVKEEDFGFDLMSKETCGEEYGYPFAKACHRKTILKEENIVESKVTLGVYVDIFPIDGIANNYRMAVFRSMIFQLLHGLLLTSNWKVYQKSKLRKWYYEPFRYLCFLLSKLLNRKWIGAFIQQFVLRYSYENSLFVGRLVGDFGSKEVMEKSIFEERMKVLFESHEFWAIKKYDCFLKKLYGDYMQLPPENKQKTHHRFKAYACKFNNTIGGN